MIRKASCSSVFDFLIPHRLLSPKEMTPVTVGTEGQFRVGIGSAHTSLRAMPLFVFQVAPADGFSDLAMQVMTSPSKNYILSVISGSICILFLIGLMCGRITKRVTRELKDR